MARPVVDLDRCEELAGHAHKCAGRFVYKLARWHLTTDVIRDGRNWVAQSHERWAEDMKLSITQFQYLLEKCVMHNLIVRETHLRGYYRTMFVRLSDEALDGVFAKTGTGKSAKTLIGSSANFKSNLLSLSTLASSSLAQDARNLPEELEEGFPASKPEQERIVTAEDVAKEGLTNVLKFPAMTTAVELKHKFDTTPLKSVDTMNPDKIATLVHVWQVENRKRGNTALGVTLAMKGMFGYLLKTLPAGTAPAFLGLVIRNWGDFTDKAEKDYGAFATPDQPVLSFIVKHLNAGTGLKDHAPQSAIAKPVKVHLCAPVAPTAKTTKGMTPADFAALNAELEAEETAKAVAK